MIEVNAATSAVGLRVRLGKKPIARVRQCPHHIVQTVIPNGDLHVRRARAQFHDLGDETVQPFEIRNGDLLHVDHDRVRTGGEEALEFGQHVARRTCAKSSVEYERRHGLRRSYGLLRRLDTFDRIAFCRDAVLK